MPLLSALEEYRSNRSQNAFTVIYGATAELRHSNARHFRDKNAALELFDDTLLRVLGKPVTDAFIPYLGGALRNARTDYFRKRAKDAQRLTYVDGYSDNQGAPTPQVFVDTTTPESVYMRTDSQKRARQLLTALIPDIPTDLSCYNSPSALAHALGLHHTAVIRKARRIYANRSDLIAEIV